MTVSSERETARPPERDDGAESRRDEDDRFPYDGGLARLELPGSEPSEE
jgi:hypothetical protein